MASDRARRRLLTLGLLLVALGWSPLACPAQEEAPAAGGPESVDPERRRATIKKPTGPEGLGLSLSGALRGGVQWIVNPRRARDDAFGTGSLDLVLTARPTEDVTLLVDVESLAGPGPDQGLGSLSRVHFDAERLEGDQQKIILREAWVRLRLFDGSVRFNVGKLDVTHYFDRNFFAEDDTRQFLNVALLNSPALRPPPNGPGASIRISQGDWRYAFGVHAPGDVGDDLSGLPYVIAELGRRDILPLKGHYRWWARVGSVPERRDDVTWGTGVSIDQLVAAATGVFVRAGWSRSEGEPTTSHAWSAGVQHTPAWLGRGRDLVGAGYGFQREPAGRERVAEAYYNASLAACCSLIANVEWIFSGPNQVTGRRNRDVAVPGLRALIVF